MNTGSARSPNATTPESPRWSPGAHLITRRRGYSHHGIYVGNGQVVHYAGRIRRRGGLVEQVAVEEFTRGGPVQLSSSPGVCFDREEIVRRARSRLGEHHYRLFSNNCEHFCNWCVRGRSFSEQVEHLLSVPARLLRAARHACRLPSVRAARIA